MNKKLTIKRELSRMHLMIGVLLISTILTIGFNTPIRAQELDSVNVATMERINNILTPITLAEIIADPLFEKNQKPQEGLKITGGVRIGYKSIPREDNTTLTIQTLVKGDTTKPEGISVWVKQGEVTPLDLYNGSYGEKVLELTNPSDQQSDLPIGYSNVNFFGKQE